MSIQVSTRIDQATKDEFDKVCESIGLSASSAISLLIKGVINFQGIPFTVTAVPNKSLDPFYSPQNMARLKAAIADANAGRNMTEHELIEVDDD